MTLAEKLLPKYDSAFWVYFQPHGCEKPMRFPVWRMMEKYLYITAKTRDESPDKKIPFQLNYPQCRLYAEMAEQALAGQPVRIDILKARQIGFSTFIAGFLFIMTMFTPNFHCAVIADEKQHAHNIFRKYQYFYDHLDDSNPYYPEIVECAKQNKGALSPLTYKPTLKYNKGQEYMETAKGGSILEVLVAGESAGRSDTYDALHLSECAFFQGNLLPTITAATQTVPAAKRTFIFLETTAKGFNDYKRLWDEDYGNQGSYKALFVPWFENPAYRDELRPMEKFPVLEDWMQERQEHYKLDDSQMLWYWRRYLDSHRDRDTMFQEYPFSPVEAFIATGGCVFGAENVATRKQEIYERNPIVKTGLFTFGGQAGYMKPTPIDGDIDRLKLERIAFRQTKGGIRFFEEPKKGEPYVLICDPNKEMNEDDVAIQVIDNVDCRQVASFNRDDMMLDSIAYQIYCLGRYYNDALVSVEMGTETTVMNFLIRLGYPKLYVRQKDASENYRESLSKSYGHVCSPLTRGRMLEMAKIAFNENPRIVSDYRTLCEMESFQRTRHESRSGQVTLKSEAAPGKHDDLVMAWAAFFEVRNQQSMVNSAEADSIREGARGGFNYDEWQKRRIAAINGQRHGNPSPLELACGIDFGGGY